MRSSLGKFLVVIDDIRLAKTLRPDVWVESSLLSVNETAVLID